MSYWHPYFFSDEEDGFFLVDNFGKVLLPDNELIQKLKKSYSSKKSLKKMIERNNYINCSNSECKHESDNDTYHGYCLMFPVLYPEEYQEEIKEKATKKDEPIKTFPGYVYLLKSAGIYKVGRTKSIKNRLKGYSTENPHGFELIFYAYVEDYCSLEKQILKSFERNKFRGEWFNFNEKEVEEIKSLIQEKALNEEEYV